MAKKTAIEQVKADLVEKTQHPGPPTAKQLLNTGSTLLNLAISGRPGGGFLIGGYTLYVGDSSSGKSMLVLTSLAEAASNPRFDNHKLVFNNVEDGAHFDFVKFFGKKLADRIEQRQSVTIDDFYFDLDDTLDSGPCIYILDSMDALSSESEGKKFKERKKASARGPAALAKVTGDYGDGKAKKNSAGLRQALPKLKATGSILIIICQTRDNIEQFTFEKKTRAGGRALKFYAQCEIWTSVVKKLKKTVRGTPLPIGIIAKAQVKKNRITGKDWAVEVPIYFNTGIDEIGSCINYLVEWKHWKLSDKGVLTAPEFDFVGRVEKLIAKIEEEELERELRAVVTEVWRDVEAQLEVKRKPRYG